MKKILVVVGSLFVLLVLAYLFQQKDLKEQLTRNTKYQQDGSIAPLGQSAQGGPGPGNGTVTRAEGVGGVPVDSNVPEYMRRIGMNQRGETVEGSGPPYTITDERGRDWKTSSTPEEDPPNTYRVLDEHNRPTDSLYSPEAGLTGTVPVMDADQNLGAGLNDMNIV